MKFIVALLAAAATRRTQTALFLATRSATSVADDVSCVGWDGRPLLSGGHEVETARRRGTGEEGQETEDDREYYKKHKPSPLSEVEFVDTRKPITRATSHGGGDDDQGYVLVRESVDDALRRAEEMWRAAKVRGDPESPQSKALARMLGRRYYLPEFEAVA